MALEVIAISSLAVGLAYILLQGAPGVARGLVYGRQILFGVVGVISALILISTGMTDALIVGFLVLFIIALTMLVDRPDKEVW